MFGGGDARNLGQYRVQRHFADHRAVTPGTAIEYAPPGAVERKAFEKLRESGVIRQTSPAHFWFDLDRMGRGRRRTRNPKLPIAIALSAVLIVLTYMLYRS